MKGEAKLLEIRGLRMDGLSGGAWHPILKGIDLTLARGEILGVIGESGAGKSTLGLAAMGYARNGCRFTGGTIHFRGADVRGLPAGARRRLRGQAITYVAQSAAASFNPARRIIDQVTETAVGRGLLGRGEAVAAARALFAQLNLPDPQRIGERYPHEVSGGQLQRLMTAMAMLVKPDIIVADEPTTALDVTTQVEVLAAIRSAVAGSGTAAIYISHDLAVVAQLADRVMVMRHGELVEEGETRAMLATPKAEYTRTLWAVRHLAKTPRPDDVPVLEVSDIVAAYGRHVVLDGVSTTVRRGQTLAIVGESGSGKSTLARVIAGLLPPRQGRLHFAGEPLPPALRQRDREQLRRIQMVTQSPDAALNPTQRVRDVIGRPLQFYHRLSGPALEARIRELLAMIELDAALIDRLPGALSGGQKQRLCIARALAAEPVLVICDEVTSALDQIVQEGILKLLARLQSELKLAYCFITHDIAAVRAIADEVMVLHHGRVVEQGPRDAIFTPPHADYTARLLASVPEMDPDWLDGVLAGRAQAQ